MRGIAQKGLILLALLLLTVIGLFLSGALTGGTKIAFRSLRVTARQTVAEGLQVRSSRGEPIADIERIVATYDLREALPGGKRFLGLSSIDVLRPHLTLLRRADGSFAFPLPSGGAAGTPPSFLMRLHVSDGSLAFTDETRIDPASRTLRVDGVNASAALDMRGLSRYSLSAAYRQGERSYPLRGSGMIEAPTGFNAQHWSADRIPLARLINYGANSPQIHAEEGDLSGIEMRFIAFSDDRGIAHPHLAAHATLDGLRVAIKGLSRPAHDIHGTLDAYENGVLSRDLVANVGDIPVRIAGGLLDFAHPQLRVRASGRAAFAQLRLLAPAIAHAPIDGPLAFSIEVEGDAAQPRTFVSFSSQRIAVNALPLDQPHGTIALDADETDVVSFAARYGNARLRARGRIASARGSDALTLIGGIDAPANAVPYAAAFAPGMTMHADMSARGQDARNLQTIGAVFGSSRTQTLAGTFTLDERGAGTVGPLLLGDARRWVYARALTDLSHDKVAALIGARDFHVRSVAPSMNGTLDANLFGARADTRLGIAGNARINEASFAHLALGNADARFSGNLGSVRISSLHARGAWGFLAGSADTLFGREETVALIRDGALDLAQAPHLPIRDLHAMIGLRGQAVHIYAANARAAGGEISLSGDSQRGSGIALIAKRLDPSAFAAFGSPLRSGRMSLAATLKGFPTHPAMNGVFVLDGSRYGDAPIDAGARAAFLGTTFSVRDAVMRAGPSVLDADGNVAGLDIARRAFAPRYDLSIRLRAADAHEAALLALPSDANDIQGNLEADLHVGGSGSRPRVAGSVTIPEGSYRGLAMSDFSGAVSAGANEASFRAATSFGSTRASMSASATSAGDMHAEFHAPRADLADFNDFFDDGDMLAGRGYLDLSARLNAGRLQNQGNISFTQARVQRFSFNDMSARWHSVGRTIAFDARANAANERARAIGTATLPTEITLGALSADLPRSAIAVRAELDNIDLAERLPQFGINAPVKGLLDMRATARGRYPDLDVAARADVRDASAAGVPIRSLNATASLARGRGSLTSAHLELASLQADASGSFGLHADDPTSLIAHASSPDVSVLLKQALHHATDIGGAFDTTVRVRGTMRRPSIDQRFNISSLRYQRFTVPQVRGELIADRKNVALRDGEIDFKKGRMTIAGVAPLGTRSAFDASRTPVSLTLFADDAEASNFVDLLPLGSKASGRLDGRMHVGGTLGNPSFQGLLTFADGSFAQPKERIPLSDLSARLSFAGTSATLESLHAQAGKGTLDGAGTASLPDLHDPKQTHLLFKLHADHAEMDIPGKFKGQVDGDLSVQRDAGKIPVLGGSLAVSQARIPMTALTPSGSSQASAMPFDLAFGLRMSVRDDVRVQSSNVDVGAKGHLALSGTLAAPTAAGRLKMTDGSMDFYRHFDLQNGTLTFDPSQGMLPYADIVATTTIPSPETAVTLRASGPATNLNVQLASDPAYSREQILGLLIGAQQIGAVSGTAPANGTPFSASSALEQTAVGQVNQAFTRNLLEPLSSKLGSSLGLENLRLTNNLGSTFNANAVKKLGKNLDVSFAQAFGTTPRSSLALDYRAKKATFLNFTAYQQTRTTLNGITAPQIAGSDPSQQSAAQLQSMEGEQGFLFSLERKWLP